MNNETQLTGDWTAEAAILGGILFNPKLGNRVFSYLDETHFLNEQNRIVFRAMRELHEEKQPVDIVTIPRRIASISEGFTGINKYLSELMRIIETASPDNLDHYVHLLHEDERLRKMQDIAEYLKIKTSIRDDSEELLSYLAEEIRTLRTGKSGKDSNSLSEMMRPLLEHVYSGEKMKPGIKVGFPSLDRLTYGFGNGWLILIMARPKTGKTAMMLQMALQAAKLKHKPYVFSLEQGQTEISNRILTNRAKLNHHSVRSGEYSKFDMNRVNKWCEELNEYGDNIHFDTSAVVTPGIIKSKLEIAIDRYGTDIAFIDYSKFISLTDTAGKKGYQIEGEKIRETRIIAKELGIPIVLLGQAGRSATEHTDGRPRPEDWYGADAAAQDCDMMLMLWRPELYGVETTKYMNRHIDTKNRTCMIVALFRHGPTGEIWFDWEESRQMFTEIDWRHEEDDREYDHSRTDIYG